ncbi:MAG: hypothetical protein JWO03_2671 [Bacteroidetes bacterium]|nr:hypothetical protein [Bacteroidota bacterium]
MKRSKHFLIGLVVLLAGCSSTSTISTWKADNAQIKRYEKILVIGIMADTNRDLRQHMEKALVEDLRFKGLNAISAFDEYGPQAFKRMTEEQVNEQIRKKGYDGVITISLLNKSKEKYYVPGSLYYTPFGFEYGYFWGYYSGIYDRVYTPGYYETANNYLWESNLYDLSNGKLIYSVQSRSFDPSDAEALGQDYGRTIVRSLIKNGILVK